MRLPPRGQVGRQLPFSGEPKRASLKKSKIKDQEKKIPQSRQKTKTAQSKVSGCLTEPATKLILKNANMNIAQALKTKNRIIGEMNKLLSFVEKHNVSSKKAGSERSAQSGGATPKAVREAFSNYLELGKRLVGVKSSIQAASAPIAGKLVEMAETKSLLTKVQGLPVRESVSIEGGYGKETYEVEYSSVITEKEQIALGEDLQNKVNALQDEIDAFNATTQV